MPAVRSGLCLGGRALKSLLRRWQRSPETEVWLTTSHPWMARLSLTGHPATWQRRFQPAGNGMGISRWRQEDSMGRSSRRKEASGSHHPGTRNPQCWSQVLPSTPLLNLPPASPYSPPEQRCVLGDIVLVSFSVCWEETEPPKGTGQHSQCHESGLEAQLRTGSSLLCPFHPQLSQSTPVLICF